MSTDATNSIEIDGRQSNHEKAVADAIALLHSWSEGGEEDAREQRETFAAIAKGIDESRTGFRTLFDDDRA